MVTESTWKINKKPTKTISLKTQKAEIEKNGFTPTLKKALCYTKHWMNEDFTWHYWLEVCKGLFLQ